MSAAALIFRARAHRRALLAIAVLVLATPSPASANLAPGTFAPTLRAPPFPLLARALTTELREQMKACDAGSAEACAAIARFYIEGNTPADLKPAMKFLAAACTAGHGWSCNTLGMNVNHGAPATEDDPAQTKAMAFFLQACGLGNKDGCFNAAVSRQWGEGAKKDPVLAIELYEKACALDHPEGCRVAGRMLAKGEVGSPDLGPARANFARGCALKDQESCVGLAGVLVKGKPTAAATARATALYSEACSSEVPLACEELALLTFDKARPEGANKAELALLNHACSFGRGPSCRILGEFKEAGGGGDEDKSSAIMHFRKGCLVSDAASCEHLKLPLPPPNLGPESDPESHGWHAGEPEPRCNANCVEEPALSDCAESDVPRGLYSSSSYNSPAFDDAKRALAEIPAEERLAFAVDLGRRARCEAVRFENTKEIELASWHASVRAGDTQAGEPAVSSWPKQWAVERALNAYAAIIDDPDVSLPHQTRALLDSVGLANLAHGATSRFSYGTLMERFWKEEASVATGLRARALALTGDTRFGHKQFSDAGKFYRSAALMGGGGIIEYARYRLAWVHFENKQYTSALAELKELNHTSSLPIRAAAASDLHVIGRWLRLVPESGLGQDFPLEILLLDPSDADACTEAVKRANTPRFDFAKRDLKSEAAKAWAQQTQFLWSDVALYCTRELWTKALRKQAAKADDSIALAWARKGCLESLELLDYLRQQGQLRDDLGQRARSDASEACSLPADMARLRAFTRPAHARTDEATASQPTTPTSARSPDQDLKDSGYCAKQAAWLANCLETCAPCSYCVSVAECQLTCQMMGDASAHGCP